MANTGAPQHYPKRLYKRGKRVCKIWADANNSRLCPVSKDDVDDSNNPQSSIDKSNYPLDLTEEEYQIDQKCPVLIQS